MQIEKKLRRTKGDNVDGKNKQKRKEQQHIHVQNALSIQSRTQSPVMCFWGERRLGLLSITSVFLRQRFFVIFRSFTPLHIVIKVVIKKEFTRCYGYSNIGKRSITKNCQSRTWLGLAQFTLTNRFFTVQASVATFYSLSYSWTFERATRYITNECGTYG